MLVLNALDFDLQSCMTSLTFLFIDIKILVMLPYIRSYFITTEFHTFNIRPSNINTRDNDPIQNNNNNKNNDNNSNNNNNNNNNNNDFNNNISKYYRKIRKHSIFCFLYSGGAFATQDVICHPPVKQSYKIRIDHK